MRVLTFYLVIYFLLLGGALLALWRSRILQEIPLVWVVGGGSLAVALGVLLALASRRPKSPPTSP